MGLADEVIARYPESLLVQLTNHDDPAATTIDTAHLALAVVDVSADFLTYAQVEYDGALPQHVAEACVGVVHWLRARKLDAGPAAQEAYVQWTQRLHDFLRLTGSRNRVMPQSSSPLKPTAEQPNSPPYFDTATEQDRIIPRIGRDSRYPRPFP